MESNTTTVCEHDTDARARHDSARALRGRAVSNARWIAVSRVVSIGVQLLSLAWLSRLLTPADYGLVAMAMVVTNLATLVRDMGMTQALIQRESLSDETILTSFWFTVGVGLALGAIVALASPLAALAFDAPGVTGILCLLAISFPVLGSTTVHQALLERESRFPLLARIAAVSSVAGLTVGVTAAYLGAGAYSLALNSLTVALVSSCQLWLAAPLSPRWLWSSHEFRGIRQFSDYLVGFNLINYFSLNADSMIIGRFLGAGSLGLYSLAYRIVDFPVNNLTFVASSALFPVMSRQQAVPEEMANLYLRTLAMIAFITAPMMAGLIVVREPFIEVVLGRKWLGMSDVLMWLSAVGFVNSLTCTTGSVLMARGRTNYLLYLGIVGVVLQVPAFVIGLKWGVEGVAAGHLVASAITAAIAFTVVLRVLGRGTAQVLLSVGKPIAFAMAMALAVLACRPFILSHELPVLIQLVVLASIGGATYLALAWMFARQSLREATLLFKRRR
ncbi:MAG: MOP flippase family protein [Burkholderiales bacterium]